jgi:hypothetical protein
MNPRAACLPLLVLFALLLPLIAAHGVFRHVVTPASILFANPTERKI